MKGLPVMDKAKKFWLFLLSVVLVATTVYAVTTTTNVGRMEIAHPDFAHDGGTALHGKVRTAWTTLSDNSDSRFEAFSAIADSTTVNHRHNFGVDFDDIGIMLYTGTHPTLTRVADPAAAGWTITAGTPAKEVIDITTPGSGGPHTFAIQVTQGTVTEKIDDLDDVDVTTAAPEDGQALVFDSGSSEWIPGASGDSSLKCQTVTDPNLTIKAGNLILDDQSELHIASDLTVSLDTILGSDPVDATTYYLFADLDAIPAEAALANGRVVRTISTASHFALFTAANRLQLQNRYVPLCFITSATTGTVWSGAGASFDTLATRRHGRPAVNISPTVYELAKQTVGAVGTSGQILAGHILADASFPAFTTEISYYHLNDVNDDSGNARTLSNIGSITFGADDILGNASSAMESDTSKSLYSADAFFDPGDIAFSIGGWFKADDWTPASEECLFAQAESGSDLVYEICVQTNGNIEFSGTNTASSYDTTITVTDPKFTNSEWHHFVWQFDATNDTLNAYIDGELAGTGTLAALRNSTTNTFRIGARFGTFTNFFLGDVSNFFASQLALTADDIRKIYASKLDHNQDVLVENQEWFGTGYSTGDAVVKELNSEFVVFKTANSLYFDHGLISTDSLSLRMQNQSFTTTVVPIKTFTTGLQSSDPGTQTHGLGCTPKDFYVLHEGASLSGDFDKRYDLCSADDTSITCDLSSLTIDATHRVEIVGSCAPIALSLPAADATTNGTVTTGAQTFAGAKTFSAVADFTLGLSIGGNETLDVYDEATATAALNVGASVNVASATLSDTAVEYTEIGNWCFAEVKTVSPMTLSAASNTATRLRIDFTSLPAPTHKFGGSVEVEDGSGHKPAGVLHIDSDSIDIVWLAEGGTGSNVSNVKLQYKCN